jgi:hypothetical protein
MHRSYSGADLFFWKVAADSLIMCDLKIADNEQKMNAIHSSYLENRSYG